MPQLTQGLIVAVLIGLLLAIIVGYYLRQGQVNDLSKALHQSQKRQEELAQEHEQRMRDATAQLQKDYETQLAESMEHYQAQYDEQRSQMEAEYRARLSMAAGGGATDIDSTIEHRIRKQYETRLKEAATKIQQAYEAHLQEKLVAAQQDYEQRLAAAIAGPNPGPISLPESETSAMESVNSTDLAEIEARLQSSYDQRLAKRLADYQDDMNRRLAQLEQDYEARLTMVQAGASAASPSDSEPSAEELELNLRRELETSLREEYEQKLAEKIEHYQDELTQRTQELEQSYEARLQLLQAAPAAPLTPANDAEESDGGEFDLNAQADEMDFDSLLGSAPEGAKGDEFDLDSSFDSDSLDSDSLDLEALLNDPAQDETSDGLIEGLDDISDLS